MGYTVPTIFRLGRPLCDRKGRTAMELIRITDLNDPRAARSLAEYQHSFPRHEQRPPASQAAIMADGDYQFLLIQKGQETVGTILLWETADFIYVEHLYIYAACRGRDYGSRTLAALARRKKVIILEIAPPEDPVALRRQQFYIRNGFVVNPSPHIHPPYRPEYSGHPLVVMTAPRAISPAEYAAFADYLRRRVMGQ